MMIDVMAGFSELVMEYDPVPEISPSLLTNLTDYMYVKIHIIRASLPKAPSGSYHLSAMQQIFRDHDDDVDAS
jgi:hypothetical protein